MKDNKLIADFMCNQYTNFVGKNDRYKWQLIKDGVWYEEKDLLYDKSWDWILPVILKIDSLNIKNDEYNLLCKYIKSRLQTISRDLVYESVIKFINWHNNNNKINK